MKRIKIISNKIIEKNKMFEMLEANKPLAYFIKCDSFNEIAEIYIEAENSDNIENSLNQHYIRNIEVTEIEDTTENLFLSMIKKCSDNGKWQNSDLWQTTEKLLDKLAYTDYTNKEYDLEFIVDKLFFNKLENDKFDLFYNDKVDLFYVKHLLDTERFCITCEEKFCINCQNLQDEDWDDEI